MRARTILLIILITASALIGCDRRAGYPDDIVAVAIAQTVTARPAATSQPTLTSQATLTPLPTLTAQATLTPVPTLMPQASATARPTYTPLPTLTPPATATADAAGSAASGGGSPQAGSTFDRRFLNIIRDYFNEMAAMIFIGNRYDPANPAIVIGLDDQLECPEYLGLYNAYQARLLNGTPAGSAAVQAAYHLYVEAVANFNPLATIWAERCVVALSNGEENVHLQQADVLEMIIVRDASLTLIDQARSALESGDE